MDHTDDPADGEDPEGHSQQLGRIIGAEAPEIERRWLQRIQEDVARTPDIELTQLRDGIPDYLAALGQLLSAPGASKVDAEGATIWSHIAREHGITRVRIGFDIDQLIHEFVVLRHVIRAVAGEHGMRPPPDEANLADLIDAAITEAVRAYVEARNFEARRTQAENVGFLTHELRNPLSMAVHATALLRQQATPGQERALDALDRSHRRLVELIDGVLSAGRQEAEKIEPRIEEIREGDLIDRATEAARAAAAAKGLTLEIRSDPERRLRLDPALTGSAIQNLVDNAVTYTDTGGVEVTIDARETDWTVHVRDGCHGLSAEELRTIFEPFRRGSTTKKGTGLGLAIARRAIEAQGGSIHAESPGPTGCHFWITLPRR